MIKKKFFSIIFILLLFSNKLLLADIEIIAKVDDEIITNYDLVKEINYLEILNPNLTELKDNQKLEVAKSSLINEIIKKKEIEKFLKIESNQFTEDYLKNLLSKLNISSEEEFIKQLAEKNVYNLSKIKDKINIDLFWNELIYLKYKNQVNINEENLISKIENAKNKSQKELFLSEIVFIKKKNVKLEDLIEEIKLSINEIGFNNTANIYSISESSKIGGKLGWVKENSLSNSVNEKLKLINIGEYTDTLKLGNNFLILKVEDIKQQEIKFDKEKELERLTKLETNKQLNKFSKIYFDKTKINYSINEK
jgi:peptidyl-prolyl cis-trans isomerase SurA